MKLRIVRTDIQFIRSKNYKNINIIKMALFKGIKH